MRGFKLIQRTSSQRTIHLARYHHPRSLTWSWILSLSREPSWHLGFFPHRDNNGVQWVALLGPFSLQWQRQKPMWIDRERTP